MRTVRLARAATWNLGRRRGLVVRRRQRRSRPARAACSFRARMTVSGVRARVPKTTASPTTNSRSTSGIRSATPSPRRRRPPSGDRDRELGSRRIRIHGTASSGDRGSAKRAADAISPRCRCRGRGHKRRIRQSRAELGVRRHAADNRDALDPGRRGSLTQSLGQGKNDRALVGAARSARRSATPPSPRSRAHQRRRLDAGEEKSRPGTGGDREPERLGIALTRQRIDFGAARIGAARAAVRLCRTPLRPRRRASCRAARTKPCSRTDSRSVCPPLASRQTKGGSTGASPR